ncbi:Golgi-associated plant pathogenesis-related protein 1 isoform X1 [Salmo salar]|uniref:Golgi-associated plant pathogenesis-related protein 1 isoform X1 n=1 Tax=Salmo salar TaxID=8030 RepID=A0A1S3NL88_SALSA|nr:Golgi-associated plant pathogenesis-related protein 1 isoform X1 [Salmo salar]|eukprot:XP_014016015.1 PREDICTED: Golgi-associated plant pathogenesis-related protein 1-like isoform X1 [Salmo salar]
MAGASFEQEFLDTHNAYRRKHGTPKLTLSRDLCNSAQEWADHLVAINTMQHSNTNNGENLYYTWSSAPNTLTGKEAVDNWYSEIKDYNFSKPGFASNTSTLLLHIFWKMCGLRSCVQNANYVELKQKAFNHIGFNKAKTQRGRFNHNLMYCGISPIGHFTQVVWKESTEVGVGLGINGETVFVVGQYNTAGNMNMEGYFIDNVLPEGGGEKNNFGSDTSTQPPRSEATCTVL